MVSSFIAHWLRRERESSELLFLPIVCWNWKFVVVAAAAAVTATTAWMALAVVVVMHNKPVVTLFVFMVFGSRTLLSYVNFYWLEMWFIEWIIDIKWANGKHIYDRVDWMNICFIMYGFIVYFLCMSYSFLFYY